MFYNARALETIKQEQLDAAVLSKINDLKIADCGQFIKRG
jgi:hypothetical protein